MEGNFSMVPYQEVLLNLPSLKPWDISLRSPTQQYAAFYYIISVSFILLIVLQPHHLDNG